MAKIWEKSSFRSYLKGLEIEEIRFDRDLCYFCYKSLPSKSQLPLHLECIDPFQAKWVTELLDPGVFTPSAEPYFDMYFDLNLQFMENLSKSDLCHILYNQILRKMKAEIRPGYRIRLGNIELRQSFRDTLQFQVRCLVQFNCFLCYNSSRYNLPSRELWVDSGEYPTTMVETIKLEPLYISSDKIGYHMSCLKQLLESLEEKSYLQKRLSRKC